MADATMTSVNLVRGEFVVVDSERIDSIHVAAGEIWLTRDGDVEDHFVPAGRAMRLADGRGRVFIQARTATRVNLSAAQPARGAGWLTRMLGAVSPALRVRHAA